jgi:hypothetical protein
MMRTLLPILIFLVSFLGLTHVLLGLFLSAALSPIIGHWSALGLLFVIGISAGLVTTVIIIAITAMIAITSQHIFNHYFARPKKIILKGW